MYCVGELVVTSSDYSPQNSHADLRPIVEAFAAAGPLPVSTAALSNPPEKVPAR